MEPTEEVKAEVFSRTGFNPEFGMGESVALDEFQYGGDFRADFSDEFRTDFSNGQDYQF